MLGVVAFGFRRKFPPDGLFFDDAWQAFAAAKGSFSQLLTVGQTQPGFGLVLMVWSRIFGQDTVSMITPALIAGTLGPPSLYLVLRRFRFSQSVAALLGSALVVCATDIVYSGRVKSYTGEVLCVLALTLVVPWLARRTWTTSTAIAWFAGSMVVAVFSSFALLATVGAGIILVLHPKRDRELRGAAVAAQAVGILVVLDAVGRTHSADGLNGYFDRNDGFLSLSLNPLTFGRDVFRHVTRITAMFPGGPSWFTVRMRGRRRCGPGRRRSRRRSPGHRRSFPDRTGTAVVLGCDRSAGAVRSGRRRDPGGIVDGANHRVRSRGRAATASPNLR